VILLPLRNPVQLAKAYSTLDVMSHGRAVMGVGLGGGHLGSHEDVFGYTREGRVTRFAEAVQIMKLLWTEPKASYRGRYWNFKDISMEPKPMQKPHLPIISRPSRERAAPRREARHGWMGRAVFLGILHPRVGGFAIRSGASATRRLSLCQARVSGG
jgi:alkanesulfonate monooxygenase SsuD/methylene tetrahydromethanopterin reductase-like flavin-dependent oxidoreductase (luciferase family)